MWRRVSLRRGVRAFGLARAGDESASQLPRQSRIPNRENDGPAPYVSAETSFTSSIDAVTDWFARPVLHVSNVEASLRFYVERLGFTIPWQLEDVAQVDRDGCALILSEQWPDKVGKGLMFISLNVEPETTQAYVAALDALRVELEARGATVKDGHWGYRLLVVEDPDGNQLYFNYPNQP